MALLQARRCVGCGSRYWCLCLQLDPCTALLFCFSDTADTTAVAVVCFVLLLLPDAVCHTSATITCCPPPIFRYFDPETVGLDFQGMVDDLTAAPDGSVVVLHGATLHYALSHLPACVCAYCT